jgi:hypothetical protein
LVSDRVALEDDEYEDFLFPPINATVSLSNTFFSALIVIEFFAFNPPLDNLSA